MQETVERGYLNSMSAFVFSAQYQQNPMPIGGGMIKKEWMHYYQQKCDLYRRHAACPPKIVQLFNPL